MSWTRITVEQAECEQALAAWTKLNPQRARANLVHALLNHNDFVTNKVRSIERLQRRRKALMNISVLVESQEGKRYCATCLTLPGVVAEAATREESLERLRQMIHNRFHHGELVTLDVQPPVKPQPWLAVAGSLKDHPDFEEWVQNMQEYRRQVDADPDRP